MFSTSGKNKFENCKDCGVALLPAGRERNKPKACHRCRGIDNLPNYELRKVCNEALNTPHDPSDDHLMFEDDPRAEEYNKNEVGKIVKQSVGYVYTETAMADSIVDTKKN